MRDPELREVNSHRERESQFLSGTRQVVCCLCYSGQLYMYMTGLSRFQIQIIKDEDMNLRVGFGEGDFKKR